MYFVQTKPDTTSQKYYIVMTLSYLGAMLASFQSLQYVSYPTQVKSAFLYNQNFKRSRHPIPRRIGGLNKNLT